MARRFFVNGYAWIARRCFSSVSIAIADTAIAVWLAATTPEFTNDAAPIAGISRARKAGWITATASVNIGSVAGQRA